MSGHDHGSDHDKGRRAARVMRETFAREDDERLIHRRGAKWRLPVREDTSASVVRDNGNGNRTISRGRCGGGSPHKSYVQLIAEGVI